MPTVLYFKETMSAYVTRLNKFWLLLDFERNIVILGLEAYGYNQRIASRNHHIYYQGIYTDK